MLLVCLFGLLLLLSSSVISELHLGKKNEHAGINKMGEKYMDYLNLVCSRILIWFSSLILLLDDLNGKRDIKNTTFGKFLPVFGSYSELYIHSINIRASIERFLGFLGQSSFASAAHCSKTFIPFFWQHFGPEFIFIILYIFPTVAFDV